MIRLSVHRDHAPGVELDIEKTPARSQVFNPDHLVTYWDDGAVTWITLSTGLMYAVAESTSEISSVVAYWNDRHEYAALTGFPIHMFISAGLDEGMLAMEIGDLLEAGDPDEEDEPSA